jgi:branched-chain amino acid transport system ATP-binding protein
MSAGTESPAALTLSGVSRSFGGLRAVDGVSVEVRAGERRAIIGPNGAGKTTLFGLISGEIAPSAGRITLFGRDVTRLPPHRRAALGLGRTYQITNLFPRLTVLDNCLLAAQARSPAKLHLHRALRRYPALFERARAALAAVGLAGQEAETVRNLSHGEQRQLEIALALAGAPRLLLLDEPTAGLSPAESQLMTALLKTLDPAITILIIEHDMDVAFALTDRITVLHFGRVVADGVGAAVKADPMVQDIYLGTG